MRKAYWESEDSSICIPLQHIPFHHLLASLLDFYITGTHPGRRGGGGDEVICIFMGNFIHLMSKLHPLDFSKSKSSILKLHSFEFWFHHVVCNILERVTTPGSEFTFRASPTIANHGFSGGPCENSSRKDCESTRRLHLRHTHWRRTKSRNGNKARTLYTRWFGSSLQISASISSPSLESLHLWEEASIFKGGSNLLVSRRCSRAWISSRVNIVPFISQILTESPVSFLGFQHSCISSTQHWCTGYYYCSRVLCCDRHTSLHDKVQFVLASCSWSFHCLPTLNFFHKFWLCTLLIWMSVVCQPVKLGELNRFSGIAKGVPIDNHVPLQTQVPVSHT